MRTTSTLLPALLLAAAFALPAAAQDGPKPGSQQSKMAACSKANKGLKGDEYKAAQKACLSKDAKSGDGDKPAAKSADKPAKTAAADGDKPKKGSKMADCAKQNKGLKGDEYKQAQKDCMAK